MAAKKPLPLSKRLVIVAKESPNLQLMTTEQFVKTLNKYLKDLGIVIPFQLERLHDVRLNAEFKKEYGNQFDELKLTDLEKLFNTALYRNERTTALQKKLYRYFIIEVKEEIQSKIMFEALRYLKKKGWVVEEVWYDKVLTIDLPKAPPPTKSSFLLRAAAPPPPDCPTNWNMRNVHHIPAPTSLLADDTLPPNRGENIVVAVLDGGILTGHTGLSSHIASSINFTTSPATTNAEPSINHGTEVAGIISSSFGGVGCIAPRARIMNVKVADSTTAYASRFAQGIHYCAQHENGKLRAPVINISWYFPNKVTSTEFEGNDQITEAFNQGNIIVFCAGNENRQVYSGANDNPRYLPRTAKTKCIIVGGVGCDNKLWVVTPNSSGTNLGKSITIGAPADWLNTLNSSTINTPINPIQFNGTSAAAPHVSGLVAVMLSNRAGLNFNQIKGLLQTHGSALDPLVPPADFMMMNMEAVLTNLLTFP